MTDTPAPATPAPDHRSPQLVAAVDQLTNHQRQLDEDGVEVGVSREALDILLAAIAEVRPADVDAATLRDQMVQMADSTMRCELALRLIRTYAMGNVIMEDSGKVRDWLRDWIDGVHHGPLGGPLLWPFAIGSVTKQLVAWGFTRTAGDPSYVVLQRAPAEGEALN